MGLARQVAFNTAVQYVGRIINVLLSLIGVLYLTRYLGVIGYGQYNTVITYIAFFVVFAEFGFFLITVRELSQKAEKEEIAQNIFSFRLALSVFIALLSVLFSFLFPYDPTIKRGILICALSILFVSLNGTIVAIFQVYMRMDKAVLGDVLNRLAFLIFVIIGAHFNLKLVWIFWGVVVSSLINFLFSFICAKKYVRWGLVFDKALWKYFFLQTLPMGAVVILGLLYSKIDIILLSILKGNAEVGIYSAAFKVKELTAALPSIFMSSVLPSLSLFLKTDRERAKRIFQKAFDFLSFLAWPTLLGTLILARPIMYLIAGREFAQTALFYFFGHPITSVEVLRIIAFAVFCSFFGNLFGSTLISLGFQKLLIIPNLVAVLFNFSLNLVLIPHFSYLAPSLLSVFTEFLALLITIFLLRKIEKISLNFQKWLKSFFAALLMALVLLPALHLNIFLLVFIGMVGYALFLYLLGGYTKEFLFSLLFKREE